MPVAILPDRAVIRIAGKEAGAWLNNLVTARVDDLAPGRAAFAALLTPQGKILADFFVHAVPEGLLLDAPAGVAGDLVRRLTMYRLRARLSIEQVSGVVVAAGWGEIEDAIPGAVPDPRWAGMGVRAITRQNPGEYTLPDEYSHHRVGQNIPESGVDFTLGDTFPHEADMDFLRGLDFKKGCYVGQEVVSRMQHRGTARTRIVPILAENPAPPPGTGVSAGERVAGVLGSGFGVKSLAMLRLDRVADALSAGEPLTAAGVPIQVLRPDWWTAPWPLDSAVLPA